MIFGVCVCVWCFVVLFARSRTSDRAKQNMRVPVCILSSSSRNLKWFQSNGWILLQFLYSCCFVFSPISFIRHSISQFRYHFFRQFRQFRFFFFVQLCHHTEPSRAESETESREKQRFKHIE